MNERLEQLALQAGMHRDKFGMYFAGDKHNEDGVDLEKFAELIVKECSNHIRDRAMQAGGAGTIVGEAEFWIADDLEKHFGVEE